MKGETDDDDEITMAGERGGARDRSTGGGHTRTHARHRGGDRRRPPPPAEEQYRPYLHFSPERNWMNDPNGLVYDDGTWHLFFQHNPYGTRWGNMSWGHATSTDLVHWEEQPLAIPQTFDANGVAIEDIFSGSVVVDETEQLAASARPRTRRWSRSTRAPTRRRTRPSPGGRRSRSPTASTTGRRGRSTRATRCYDRGSSNFRDPKVFRYTNPETGESYWVMAPSRRCSTRWCSPAATT